MGRKLRIAAAPAELADDLSDALQLYERSRRPRTSRVVLTGPFPR